MASITIGDLEYSLRLDLEAMRAIVGSGSRKSWQNEMSPFLLLGTITTGAGQRAAGTRWSAFLRRRSEPAKPYDAWRASGLALAPASVDEGVTRASSEPKQRRNS